MLSQNLACMGGFVTRTLVHMDLVRIRSNWSCRVLFAVASSARDFQCPSIPCSWRYGLGSLGTDAPARWQSCGCLLWSPPVPAWAHLSLGPGLRGRGGDCPVYIHSGTRIPLDHSCLWQGVLFKGPCLCPGTPYTYLNSRTYPQDLPYYCWTTCTELT